MTSPALTGSVVEVSHVSQPHSYAARDFFNTIRDLLHKIGYHNESELLSALDTVAGYERHVTGRDAAYVVSEADRAPVEDVSQRVAPASGLPLLAPAQQIDYARLAAAIVAAQALQAATALPASADTHSQPLPDSGVPVITDLGAAPVTVAPVVSAIPGGVA
jgi:hypothetical protein